MCYRDCSANFSCWEARLSLDRDARLSLQMAPVPSRPFDILAASSLTPALLPLKFPWPILTMRLDKKATTPSKFTSYKTTRRDVYNDARYRVNIVPLSRTEEVILWNEVGEIMEGSLRNLAFWVDGGWVTPGLSSGCLAGTVRKWLLEQGLVREGTILREHLAIGDWVLTSNGVEGCSIGMIEEL